MENHEEKSNYENENLKLSQLVLQQKREKMNLQKKIAHLEKQNKSLIQQLETTKQESEEKDLQLKQMKEFIAKQEVVTAKLNGLIKKLLHRDEEHPLNTQHDYSLSAPKTDNKSNKFSSHDIQEKKKKDQQYLEEHQKLDLNEQIIQAYKKQSLKDQSTSNKLPRIDDNNNKPIIVQVPKSQLKKINPQNIFEQLQKE